MEPHRESINDLEAFKNTFPPREGASPIVQSLENNHCHVDGVEVPVSLSVVEGVTINEESTSLSGMRKSMKKKRSKGDNEFYFKLFKFQNVEEQYLLEMHDQMKKNIIECYRVFIHEKRVRWKAGFHDLMLGDHVALEVLVDPTLPISHKKYIPLEDRLMGWSREKRLRGNGKEDKFYYHQEMQFRSFIDVITFILYSCKVKGLSKVNSTDKTPQEIRELEAAEALLKISSHI